jgi:hypothetical protein
VISPVTESIVKTQVGVTGFQSDHEVRLHKVA